MEATAHESISLDLDAVRAFEVVVSRRVATPATAAGLRPAPCGWRALFSRGHAECDPVTRRCKKCKPGAPAYSSAVEKPIVDLVMPLLVPDLAGRVVPS